MKDNKDKKNSKKIVKKKAVKKNPKKKVRTGLGQLFSNRRKRIDEAGGF